MRAALSWARAGSVFLCILAAACSSGDGAADEGGVVGGAPGSKPTPPPADVARPGIALDDVLSSEPHVVSLAAGSDFTCAADDAGAVRCWGDDSAGQLGSSSRLTPIPRLGGVVELTAGMLHACARTKTDDVWCWGSNAKKQLANPDVDASSAVPVPVVGIPKKPLRSLASGVQGSCAVYMDGDVWCWGRLHRYSQGEKPVSLKAPKTQAIALTDRGPLLALEDGSLLVLESGLKVVYPNRKIVSVTGARGLIAVRLDDGSLRSWGSPPAYLRCLEPAGSAEECDARGLVPVYGCGVRLGACGADCATPKDIPWFPSGALSQADAVVLNGGWSGVEAENLGGRDWGCIVTRAGKVACMGPNEIGQRGDGKPTPDLEQNQCANPLPREIPTLSGVVQVVVGAAHACALDGTGHVTCWGKNDVTSGSPTLGSFTQKTGDAPSAPLSFR